MGFYICNLLVPLKIPNQDSSEGAQLHTSLGNANHLNQDHLSPTWDSGHLRMNYSPVASIPFCLGGCALISQPIEITASFPKVEVFQVENQLPLSS